MLNLKLSGFRRTASYEGSEFQAIYERLFSWAPNLTEDEKAKILRWAVFFFNKGDADVKRLGYRIIVRYYVVFGDYVPLYDISLNAGFIPVSKFIEAKYFNELLSAESFLRTFLSAYKDNFKDGDKYLSEGQKELLEFSKRTLKDSLIVAPTSYGKSEMMISKVLDHLDKKVCIIVPSKALLAQTKRRLLRNGTVAEHAKRIITHPEMFRPSDTAFIAVFTQERLLRLLQKEPTLAMDVLLVDEAHNMLGGEERGALLIQALLISKHRNDNIELKFYTPFIASAQSIQSPYSNYILEHRSTKEYIKVEKYYIYEAKTTKELKLYDQFMGREIPIGTYDYDEFEFVHKNKASKNIVYLNKPRDVEEVAVRLSSNMAPVDMEAGDGRFKGAYKAISEFLHPEYKLLECLKKGVVYHHGKIPEVIRLYVETIFSDHPQFSFVVTTSTLLEGVNIPAEKMFLFSKKRGPELLTRASFKNLSGRVCRFSEIFSNTTGHLKMLEPEIYLVDGKYADRRTTPLSFLNTRAKVQDEEKDQDEIENPLLRSEVVGDDGLKVKNAIEYLENIEGGSTQNVPEDFEIRYVSTEIAKLCFRNNIVEFDIHENEGALNQNIQQIEGGEKIADPVNLLAALFTIFVQGIQVKKGHDEFARLENQAARNFYAMFLDWKMKGTPFSAIIPSFLGYWEKREREAKREDDFKIYVGSSWGETKMFPQEHVERYVDIRRKTLSQRINLAILKIKEEQDFVEYKLMKFIEVLNDLGLLERDFYDRVKYGSSDKKVICLLKNGISIELAKRLLSGKYDQYIIFNLETDEVKVKREALQAMEQEGENQILVFELQFHAV